MNYDFKNSNYKINELYNIASNNTLYDSDWSTISRYQKLNDEFIEKYQDKVNWIAISTVQTLSYSFMEKFKDKVAWSNVSRYQKLNEEFIEKYKDRVNWYIIVAHQELSYTFLEKHLYKYSLYTIRTEANVEHINKLIRVYNNKYDIDKLRHELLFTM